MTTAFLYDPACLRHQTGHHPESPERFSRILSAVEGDQALWARLGKLAPRTASADDLMRCHSTQMIEHVESICERGVPFVDLDTVISRDSYEGSKLAAGAALVGVHRVFGGESENAFALVRPPGHHATSNRSMGFCLFNNAAVAARYAQSRY